MKTLALVIALLFAATPALAVVKSCEELKNEIEAKLKAKKVATYALEVVAAAEIKDQKVVGTCEGGKKKIVYKKA
jgi:Protein of unknown function (DUF1161)